MEGLPNARFCFAAVGNRRRGGKRRLLGYSVIASVVKVRFVLTQGRGSTVESWRTFFVRSSRTCARRRILMSPLALYQFRSNTSSASTNRRFFVIAVRTACPPVNSRFNIEPGCSAGVLYVHNHHVDH